MLASTTPEVIAAIANSNVVVERFGHWIKFEDAEVLSLSFDRGNLKQVFETGRWSDAVHPSLEAVFYVFDVSRPSGSPDRKPSLLTLRFSKLDRFALNGFNHQNPIVELAILREHCDRLNIDLFAVDWGGSGLFHEASFTCERIEVIKLECLRAEM